MVLIYESLSLLHPRTLCVKFGWNWSLTSGSEEQDFFNFVNTCICLLFRNYLSFEKGAPLHLNILDFPLPKDALCQVWLKLAQRFWRRFLNFVNVSSLFCNHLPLEKGVVLHLSKLEFPSPNDALCHDNEIGGVVLEKKSKM